MAEEKTKEPFDKKAAKKAEKERRKAEKKRIKQAISEMDEEDEGGAGSKIAVFFVTVIIILIWLAIIVLLIKWDVGGFGSQILGPLLKDVPYINQILPDSVLEEEDTEDETYASMDEAMARIKELELELADAQNASTDDASYIAELEAEAEELAQYKADEAEFEEIKQKFYEEVVFGDEAPDIENYKEYYESIDPANAEVIYRQVVEQTAEDDELAQYVAAYSSMKAKQAAAIFDEMTDNLSLVAKILGAMDADTRGDILGAMDTDTAAKVTEIMNP